jgi:hypothetical protein
VIALRDLDETGAFAKVAGGLPSSPDLPDELDRDAFVLPPLM